MSPPSRSTIEFIPDYSFPQKSRPDRVSFTRTETSLVKPPINPRSCSPPGVRVRLISHLASGQPYASFAPSVSSSPWETRVQSGFAFWVREDHRERHHRPSFGWNESELDLDSVVHGCDWQLEVIRLNWGQEDSFLTTSGQQIPFISSPSCLFT